MPKQTIYTVGGTVQAGQGVYIKRKADEELLDLCRHGELAFILSSRQVGKSSLMTRTAEQLSKENVCSATIDLSSIGTSITQDAWYLGILNIIATDLNLETNIFDWWAQYEGLGAAQRFFNFLRDVLLREIKQSVVLFFDEIDTTLSISFADDFFATLRAVYNARSNTPDFKRLSFVLVGVATPSDLISDSQRTPFNIGQRVDLEDFTLEEALPLAQGLGENAEQALSWVLEWSGGHPYLTQRLCAELSKSNERIDQPKVAQVVEQLFLGEQGQQDTNLQFVRDLLVKRSPDVRRGMLTYRDVRSGKKVIDDERSVVKSHLKISGVVKRRGDRLVTRNPIYERAFDLKWIKQNTPPSTTRNIVIGASLVVALALIVAGFFAYQEITRTDQERAARLETDFNSTTDPQARLADLAGMFELKDPSFGAHARDLFNSLEPQAKMDLFKPSDSDRVREDQVSIALGVYQSVDNTKEGNDLLQAIGDATKKNKPELANEIHFWLDGRMALNNNNYYDAKSDLSNAIHWNPQNPGLYYDRAQVFVGLGENSYGDALDDLAKMVELDQNRSIDAYRLIQTSAPLENFLEAHKEEAKYAALTEAILIPVRDRAWGTDISSFDPNVDWNKVRAQGISFVFIQATQALNYVNPLFESQWAGAKDAGILRGAYHFLDPRVDCKAQAEKFLSTVTLEPGDLPPVLDLENLPTSKPSLTGTPEPKDINSQFMNCAETWLTTVAAKTGRKPIIYSLPSFLEARFTDSEGKPPAWVKNYTLWIASYPYPDREIGDNDRPLEPNGWPNWTFWQYSQRGFLDGVTQDGRPIDVDLNFYRGTTLELYQSVNLTSTPANRQPTTTVVAPTVTANSTQYTIQKGDTVASIARKHHTTVDAIMALNPQISNPSSLKVGDTLNIPLPVESTPTAAAVSSSKFQLVYYSQQDPQWKNDILGFGGPNDTIGNIGPALTSLAMLLNGYGFPETPQTLNDELKKVNGFVSSAIVWNAVSEIYPQVQLKANINSEATDAPLAEIDAALEAGQPVIVRVDASPNPGFQWHYVLIYARKGDDYLMLDPWPYKPGTTQEDSLMQRYSQGQPLNRAIQQAILYEVEVSPQIKATSTP